MAKNLSAKQREFIVEFVLSGSLKDACGKTDIVKQTYYNWLENPEFEEELKTQQEKYYDNSLSRMKRLFSAAIETQEELLKSENESIRLRAANSIIGRNGGIIEIYEQKNRLNALERKIFEKEEIKNMEARINELDSKIE